jgi:WD40 repeat protein
VLHAEEKIRVFINYAREDLASARRLHADLLQHGIDPWLDVVNLKPGQVWELETRKAIREANFVIMLISSKSVEKRGFVNAEIRECLDIQNQLPEGRVFILPARLDPCDPSFEQLRKLQCVDLFPYEAGLQKLVRVIFNEQPHRRNLTRVPDGSSAALGREDIAEPTMGGLIAHPVETVKASFRIDVLCFFDDDVLVLGSGHLHEKDTRRLRLNRLVSQIEYRHPPTGMDGRFSDHRQTRRHIELGYNDIAVVDRSTNKSVMKATCDRYAGVNSADWSPDGACVAVGSENYQAIVKTVGELLPKENYSKDHRSADINSVAWQPSMNPLFGSSTDICVCNPEGKLIRKLAQMPKTVECVAVEPQARLMVAVDIAGNILIFNEYGVLIAEREGVPSLAGHAAMSLYPLAGRYAFHASRSLAFSSDSRFLAQCACTGPGGIRVFDLRDGRMLTIDAAETNHLAWHPADPRLLVTAGEDRISFWRLTEAN